MVECDFHIQILLYSAHVCSSKTIRYETEDTKMFYGREAKYLRIINLAGNRLIIVHVHPVSWLSLPGLTVRTADGYTYTTLGH